MNTLKTFLDVLPVLLLFVLGVGLRAWRVLDAATTAGLKRIVVTLSLPVLLFDAFFRLRPDSRNLLLVAAVFASCLLMLFVGRLSSKVFRLEGPYAPLMYEGFEAGMLGYGLFLGIAGDANLPFFAACDLGQVLFVFSVLQAQLLSLGTRRGAQGDTEFNAERQKMKSLVLNFVRSPIVLAIAAGLIAGTVLRAFAASGSTTASAFIGAAGGSVTARDTVSLVSAPFWHLVATLKSLTVPLICFVIGAGIELDRENLAFALKLTATRMVLLSALAFAIGDLFAVRVLGLPDIYRFAVLVLFLLPPPFVIAVFMPVHDEKENRRVATTLSAHSLASIVAVGIVAAFFGAA
jgi:predicted permease